MVPKLSKLITIVKSFFSALAVTYVFNLSIISIWPWLIAFAFFLLFNRCKKCDKRMYAVTYTCASFFALACTLPKAEKFFVESPGMLGLCVVFGGTLLIFQWILQYIYLYFQQISVQNTKKKVKNAVLVWFGFLTSLLICWLPYYLRNYPALMSTDSLDQAYQIVGMVPYSNHHPILHTFILKTIYDVAGLISNSTTEIWGIVCAVQMTLLACVLSWCITFLLKRSRVLWILSWIFFAFCPYNGIYSVTLWKDIWFAGVTLTFFMLVWVFWEQNMNTIQSILVLFGVMLLGIFTCLLRSNAYIAFILFSFIYLVVFLTELRKRCIEKKHLKKWIQIGLCVFVSFLAATLIKGPLYHSKGIEDGDILEKLAIPIQNIAYVITYGEEITSEERDLLYEIVDVDRIPENYTSYTCDTLKPLIRQKGEVSYLDANKWEYFKLWAGIGLRYPKLYLISWVNQTKGYWYADVKFWVCWRGMEQNSLGLEQKPMVSEEMAEWIDNLGKPKNAPPFLGTFWCCGTFTWILIAMYGYAVYSKNKKVIAVYSFYLALILSLLIATPVYAEFRYIYAVVVSLPFIAVLPFLKRDEEQNKQENEVLNNK